LEKKKQLQLGGRRTSAKERGTAERKKGPDIVCCHKQNREKAEVSDGQRPGAGEVYCVVGGRDAAKQNQKHLENLTDTKGEDHGAAEEERGKDERGTERLGRKFAQ